MSNDPNDRFMISDLSSKLSAYINGEYSDKSSQTKDPSEIEDVLASEIKPAENVRKLPGDELFTDLNQALDSSSDSGEEKIRKQRLAEEQMRRQRAEDARRQQLRYDQLRQQKLQEERQRQQRLQEEQRQQRLQEEQLRQQRLQEEQRQQRLQEEQLRQQRLQEEQRQQKLRRERALARSLAESLYRFDLNQPFTSVRSGHPVRLSKLSPEVRSMPSEEAVKSALIKMAMTENAPQAASSNVTSGTKTYNASPKAEQYYEAPKTESHYEAPKAETFYEAPKAETFYEAPKAETFFEAPPSETTQSSSDETAYVSQSAGESRYAKSPDPSYRGYQDENKGGSRIAVIITLLIALAAVAAIFIMIRKYSSNLTNLLTGTPAASKVETVTESDSKTESVKENEETESPDSSQAESSQTAVSMAINEEGEIFHSDSEIAAAEESDQVIPEDPNDISYLASVNEKAAEDAIAELSPTAPKLYLSSYGIKIKAGDSFNALSYVERIEDDADERDRLYRDISVDGLGEFDAKVPGTYELTYYCYDSAGNRSNRARLTVIVE